MSRTRNLQNQVTADGRVHLSFDANGNMIEDDGTDEKNLHCSDQWQVLEERVEARQMAIHDERYRKLEVARE